MTEIRPISNLKHDFLYNILESIPWVKAVSSSLYFGMSVYVTISDQGIGDSNALSNLLYDHTADFSDFSALIQTTNLCVTFLRRACTTKLSIMRVS